MMSISKMSAGQEGYYTALALEDYYLSGGEPPGVWIGTGASRLGLSGIVEKEDLHRLFAGFSHLDGETKLRRSAGVDPREVPLNDRDGNPILDSNGNQKTKTIAPQAGWDLTFSAPKSVSVLWATTAENERREVQNAHFAAVHSAINYLELYEAECRRGEGGILRESVGLVIATYEHGTSRALDPQLHTHALVLNIGVREDGSTGTVESRGLYKARMTASAIYSAELSAQIEQRLGIETERTKDAFEIKGVPKELCDEWSTRRKEVEAWCESHGTTTQDAGATAAKNSRSTKGHVARQQLFSDWQTVSHEHGFSSYDIPRQTIKRDKEVSTHYAVNHADKALTYQHSHYTNRDAFRAIAEAGISTGLSWNDIKSITPAYLRSSEAVVNLGRFHGEQMYTSRELLELEKNMLSTIEAARENTAHVVSVDAIASALSTRPTIKDEQRDALLSITAMPGNVKVVSGMAGTGKTYMLDAAREVWESEGYKVLGLSLSGKAAKGLEAGSHIQSHTIAKFFMEEEKSFTSQVGVGQRLAAEIKHATWQIDAETKEKMRGEYYKPTSKHYHEFLHSTWHISKEHRDVLNYQLEREQYRVHEKTVLVVDESGMAGTRDMAKLVSLCQEKGAKLVLVGDSKQLQSIEAGGAHKAIAQLVGDVTLTGITRQREMWAQEAVKSFAAGRAEEGLEAYLKRGLITVSPDRTSAIHALVSDWKKEGAHSPKEHLIIAGTKAEVKALNREAQIQRYVAGELTDKRVTVREGFIYEGDRVLFTKNSRMLNVSNGDLGTVSSVNTHTRTVAVTLDDEKKVQVPLDSYDTIELGYAITTNKGQGTTVENSYVLSGGFMQDREQAYVQMSRQRGEARIYIDQESAGDDLTALAKTMNKSRQKELAVTVEQQAFNEEITL